MAAQRKSGGGRAGVGAAKGRGSSNIRLPGEKAVRGTAQSVPVRRAAKNPGGPTNPAAVDRRRQIVGTDDPGGRRDARGRTC
jgi:hypothetical protein